MPLSLTRKSQPLSPLRVAISTVPFLSQKGTLGGHFMDTSRTLGGPSTDPSPTPVGYLADTSPRFSRVSSISCSTAPPSPLSGIARAGHSALSAVEGHFCLGIPGGRQQATGPEATGLPLLPCPCPPVAGSPGQLPSFPPLPGQRSPIGSSPRPESLPHATEY